MTSLALERLLMVIRERIQGESSGLTQLDLDRVDAAIQQARKGLVGEIRQYRDRLDELKVDLGLAPALRWCRTAGVWRCFGMASRRSRSGSPIRSGTMTELPRLAEPSPGAGGRGHRRPSGLRGTRPDA